MSDDLYWDDLCCAGNSDDAHRHGIAIGRAAPADLPSVDVERLARAMDAVMAPMRAGRWAERIAAEYDRLSRLSEAREPLTYEFRHDESGYAALSPEGGSETLEQRRIRNAPEHSEEGWSR